MSPDATGTYKDAGEHNGKRYYQRVPNGWFIWWDGGFNWVISAQLGVAPPNSWQRVDPDIVGIYFAVPPATGDATVTEI